MKAKSAGSRKESSEGWECGELEVGTLPQKTLQV